jgi:phage tail sheath protein FI
MVVAPTYPGVYVQEIPSGVRSVTGVATAVGAFVDFFARGPLNTAVQVFSWSDVERIFGGLHRRSEASYALDQFFRNGGSSAWVVRVTSAAAAAASATAVARTGTAGGAGVAVTFTASSPGEWGNALRVRVEPTATAGEFDVVVREVTISGDREVVRREIRYPALTTNAPTPATPSPRFISTTVNGDADIGNGPLRVALPGGTPAPVPLGTGHVGKAIAGAFPIAAGAKALTVKLTSSTGGFTDDDRNLDLGAPAIATIEDAALRLEGALRVAQPTGALPAGRVEYAQATVRVAGSSLQVTPGVGTDPFVRFQFTTPLAATLGLDDNANSNIAAYLLGSTAGSRAQAASTAGTDGGLPGGPDLIGSEATTPPTGMFVLNAADTVNLLCLPRVARVSAPVPDTFPAGQVNFAISNATTYCERRRAMLLVDTPDDVVTPRQIQAWMTANNGLRHQNLALFYPRAVIADPLDDFRDRAIGASGAIAGICSRTDTTRGVWKAPAGTESVLRGVTRLSYEATENEVGTLNPRGINSLRRIDPYGPVTWGARTLHGEDVRSSDWKYVPVRRLALFLEESLYRSTTWVIFEENDEPLWAQIRQSVGAFMSDLFHKGAFQGMNKRDAYFVRCDATTTTPLDQQRGIVNLVVGFAPLRPAEFLIISITQVPQRLEV